VQQRADGRLAEGLVPLEVTGSLDFSLDTGSTGRVEGVGSRILVTADDPVAAFRAAAAPGNGRPALGGLGDVLAAAGLVVEVTGPRGSVATLGDGVDSPVGRLLAGSRHVRPGRLRAVTPLAAARGVDLLGPAARRLVPLLPLAALWLALRQVRRRG
jgi:hypothetical protein